MNLGRTLPLFRAIVPLALGCFVHAAVPAAAQDVEEILDYDVTIDVRDGGAMLVREEIRVRALGRQIRRGIFREVPTSFPRWSGLARIEAPFDVRSVTRNGSPEPFSLEAIGGPFGRGGMRVRIGDANVMLDPGVHEYVIEYETSRWLEFGSDTDRLYWNVTGNGWAFPIRSATARIHIEGVTAPPELESWTGPDGSTTTNATGSWDPGAREVLFETNGPLGPQEGLTVRVTVPAGRLTPPTDEQRAEWRRLDWGGWIEAAWAVLVVVALYLVMWQMVGMDPAPRRIGPRSTPPDGFSPAALGFIEARGYDESQLSAALVQMALKGAIRLERDEKTWTIEKLAEPDDLEEPLSREEGVLFRELLGARSSIRMTNAHHATLRSAIKAFRSSLATRLEQEYFLNNRRWFLTGLGLSVVGFAMLAWRWRFDINAVALFLGVWLTGWSAGVASLGIRVVQQFRAARAGGGAAVWAATGFLALFSLPFLIAEVVVTGILFAMAPSHLVVAAIGIGITNVIFYHLLERPTLKGRGVLDELDAFRGYLESSAQLAERRGARPTDRLPLYERWLPFAIALGAAAAWTEAFKDALAPALVGEAAHGPFPWYTDADRGRSFEPSGFATSLSQGLASTLTSNSSPPASSGGGGGFSGGGSSGGGGGGGGGGGW